MAGIKGLLKPVPGIVVQLKGYMNWFEFYIAMQSTERDISYTYTQYINS